MDHRLLIQSLTKYLLGVVIIGLLLFLPAGYKEYKLEVKYKVIPFIW